MSEDFKVSYLHVYSQFTWHDDALIAGDRGALESLRDAINAALDDPEPEGQAKAQLFVNDGEGYHLHVLLLKDEQMQKIGTPYTDEIAADTFDNTNNPYRLIRADSRVTA